jgi:transcription elongation GreA/GreB family factor
MLGLHAGDAATVQLPQGELEVQVLGVELAELGD